MYFFSRIFYLNFIHEFFHLIWFFLVLKNFPLSFTRLDDRAYLWREVFGCPFFASGGAEVIAHRLYIFLYLLLILIPCGDSAVSTNELAWSRMLLSTNLYMLGESDFADLCRAKTKTTSLKCGPCSLLLVLLKCFELFLLGVTLWLCLFHSRCVSQQLKLFAIFLRRLRVFARTHGWRRNQRIGSGGPEQGRFLNNGCHH